MHWTSKLWLNNIISLTPSGTDLFLQEKYKPSSSPSSPLPFVLSIHPLILRILFNSYQHTFISMKLSVVVSIGAMLAFVGTSVTAESSAYGICQSGCSDLVCSCYAAAGSTFGTVVATAAVPSVFFACNTAVGLCSAKCAVALLAPNP